MNKSQVDYDLYRGMLETQRARALAGLGARLDTATPGRVAEDDQAQVSHEEFISSHINRLDFAQLRLIEEALERLETGGYGICLACEQPIPPKRLRAVCWARYCLTCQDGMGAFEVEEEPAAPGWRMT